VFQKVLIANRGEIALRILRALKGMGLVTVVAHHAVDADSPAVLEADETVELHGSTPVASYLDIAQLVEACRHSGAQAVHTGYGFLSENAAFTRALERRRHRLHWPTSGQHRTDGRQGARAASWPNAVFL
jgi:acetyl-CoA/propionyl-CoA carboxylase biotin carboxyl carrier protein